MEVLIVGARLVLAAFLGSLIGWEREFRNRAAGFRTHIIVSVGACLIMLIAIDGFEEFYGDEKWDATRFAGEVVSGIGFLGAGTILQKKDAVSGLTTAATLCYRSCSRNWILSRSYHCHYHMSDYLGIPPAS